MELFRITENFDIELNKEWIMLIPEFKTLLAADKGSTGDADGRKKFHARKLFAYIYFMVDFKSPIESWEFAKRHNEALRYTGLKEVDVNTPALRKAYEKYELLQFEAARALKTLNSARKGLDALDTYYDNLDFTKLDKQGKLLHNPKEIAAGIAALNKMYDELDKFENRVREQLKESTTIRGQATLGDKEHKRTGQESWSEGSREELATAPRFDDLSVVLNSIKEQDKKEEEEE